MYNMVTSFIRELDSTNTKIYDGVNSSWHKWDL